MSMVKPRPLPPFPKLPREPKVKEFHWIKLRRRRLKRRSAAKMIWNDLYLLALKFLIGLDAICRRCRKRLATEGHHPLGQIGALILIFWPICRRCHDQIHDFPNEAREDGWLV